MWVQLSDGERLDLSEDEALDLYEALWQQSRERGSISAAAKLRYALTWPGGVAMKVSLDTFETVAVIAARQDESARPN